MDKVVRELTVGAGESQTIKYNAVDRGPHHLCLSADDFGDKDPVKVYFDIEYKSRTIKGGTVSTKVDQAEIPTAEVYN